MNDLMELRDADELRKLAAWYRKFAERAGNPAIWEMRLRTAEKLEAEADRVKYLNSSDTKQSAKRLNCSSISIRRTPALCYRTNWIMRIVTIFFPQHTAAWEA